jgi:gp32 DNA binding protein like
MDLDKLKRSNNFSALTKEVLKVSQPTEGTYEKDDERFWQPEVDKAGNGMAIIRFLPAPLADGDDALPWVRRFNHAFQGTGGWLIDNCLTTNNQKCPVCEHNSILWNSGIEANKEIVRKQKRKLTYIANILVISDPKNPANEGQIKLYKFGKKIFDKISEAMNPEFADETPMNPFDFWEGANFKIKIRQVEGYRNYDKSEFDTPAALSDDDEKLEKIWKSEYSLKEFVDAKHFKSYDQLKDRLTLVLGLNGVTQISSKAEDATLTSAPSLGDDDEMDYFKSLAEQG